MRLSGRFIAVTLISAFALVGVSGLAYAIFWPATGSFEAYRRLDLDATLAKLEKETLASPDRSASVQLINVGKDGYAADLRLTVQRVDPSWPAERRSDFARSAALKRQRAAFGVDITDTVSMMRLPKIQGSKYNDFDDCSKTVSLEAYTKEIMFPFGTKGFIFESCVLQITSPNEALFVQLTWGLRGKDAMANPNLRPLEEVLWNVAEAATTRFRMPRPY